MFRKTFPLTQHTPQLHFQYENPVGLLRATEVKPRLDEFLRRRAFRDNPDQANAYEIRGQQAFNYQMRISGQPQASVNADRAKGYFGNMGDDAIEKHLVRMDSLMLTIITPHRPLLQAITDHLGQFFLCHSFGSRKSRGFGSYTLTGETARPDLAKYQFTVRKDDFDDRKNYPLNLKCASHIDWFYRSLRQGINHGGRQNNAFVSYLYMKPMLFQYAMANNKQWEKKTVKERFFNRALTDQQGDHPAANAPLTYAHRDKVIVRDLLGLSSSQSWCGDAYRNATISKTDVAGNIKRFPSPLVFKPVQHPSEDFYRVYFWWNDIPNEYLNAVFTLERNGNTDGHDPLPMWADFNMSDFMTFAMDYNRMDNSITVSGGSGNKLHRLLKDIYDDITRNETIQ